MALVLEFLEIQRGLQPRHYHPSPTPKPIKLRSAIAQVAKTLEKMNTSPVLESQDSSSGKFDLGFTMQAAAGLAAFFRVKMKAKDANVQIEANILQGGSLCRLRSSEIVKSLCRTVRSINSMASRCPVFFTIAPGSQQLLLKSLSCKCSPQQLLPLLRSILIESSLFLKSFAPLVLYSSNLIPRSLLESQLQPSLRNFFFGQQGDFNRYAEIYQLMPLVNCQLEIEGPGKTIKQQEQNDEKNSNPKRIIKLFYDQKKKNQKKEAMLFCEPEPYNPQNPIFSFIKDSQSLNFPTLRDGSIDHPYIFNTINVTSHDKRRQRVLSEGGKAKIIASPTKFIYAKSMDVSKVPTTKKDDMEQESTEETDDVQIQQGPQIDRVLLVKMPRVKEKEKDYKRLLDQISYEKQVLANLRTVGCAYIPKYYHSIQEKYEHKAFLLMDYVPGNTLSQQMDLKLQSFTSSAKLHILTHISNALRFLSERGIAHLDLSPNNIIVIKDFLIKLIDFGEAYHKNTSKKYAPGMNREYERFVYSPGRTFPYAPPETSSRFDNFSSQQDMYSLGIIIHQLLFGSFPFICHQDTHKKLYHDRTYPQRIFLAPERAELYGQLDFMTLLTNLTIKLLDCDQRRRPHPIWAHIIIKKLFYAIR